MGRFRGAQVFSDFGTYSTERLVQHNTKTHLVRSSHPAVTRNTECFPATMPGPAFLSQQDAAGEKLGPPQKQQNAGAKLLVITYIWEGKLLLLWRPNPIDIRGAAYPAEKKKQ
ncbi:hypothetical protein G3M48_001860 [Beauveria asiatica]|uniref:Uncharacterized protein n=1 Tax=Beauveria asiatica TaxID=1069075 RepID=A0AAW0RYH3_9HYPO